MEKQIKDLTFQERLNICNKYITDQCSKCPFKLYVLRTEDEGYYCVHHILNVLERKIIIKENE